MTLRSGQTIANRYILLDYLGAGGMGSVWSAGDLRLGKKFALKFLHPQLSQHEEANVRFVREAKAAAACVSPFIVTVYDVVPALSGAHGAFIVMELLYGLSLEGRLRSGPLPSDALGRVIAEVGRGLEVAHGLGIVHRDLKPANIFLVENKAERRAVVLDFGIASLAAESRITRTGFMGTLGYCAPEQLRSARDADLRSDLWSLGMVVYECVVGVHPFHGMTDLQIYQWMLQKQPLPSPTAEKPLSETFQTWFERACNYDRNGRFDSSRTFVESLLKVLVNVDDRASHTETRGRGVCSGGRDDLAIASVTSSRAAESRTAGRSNTHNRPTNVPAMRVLSVRTRSKPATREHAPSKIEALDNGGDSDVQGPRIVPTPGSGPVAAEAAERAAHKHLAFGSASLLTCLLAAAWLVCRTTNTWSVAATKLLESPILASAICLTYYTFSLSVVSYLKIRFKNTTLKDKTVQKSYNRRLDMANAVCHWPYSDCRDWLSIPYATDEDASVRCPKCGKWHHLRNEALPAELGSVHD